MVANGRTDAAAQPVLVIEREFDAPMALVWQAWTRREHLMRWFCPKDFTVLFAEMDLCPGGRWRSAMQSPEGKQYIHHGTYREIDPPRRLVFTHAWERDDPEQPCQSTVETLVTVTFAERQGRTTMRFEQVGFESVESCDSHRGGWSEAFDNLGEQLPTMTPERAH